MASGALSWRKSPPKEKENHAVVVAHWRDSDKVIHFLTGQESGYLVDKDTKKKFRDWPEAKTHKQRDDLIRAIIEEENPDAHFVIRIKDDKEKFTLQVPDADSKRGFPKGGANEKDKRDKDESDTSFMKKVARREFEEEIGYKIPLQDLKYKFEEDHGSKHYFVFAYQVTNAIKREIEESIEELEDLKEGELFHTKFEPASKIESQANKDKYNGITRSVTERIRRLVTFRGGGLTRKQTKRKRRYTRRR